PSGSAASAEVASWRASSNEALPLCSERRSTRPNVATAALKRWAELADVHGAAWALTTWTSFWLTLAVGRLYRRLTVASSSCAAASDGTGSLWYLSASTLLGPSAAPTGTSS